MNQTSAKAIFFGNTDTGRHRDNNEDTFIACRVWDDDHLLLAAIDGIGGYEGGEVAAEIARITIIDEVSSNPGADCLQLLKEAVTKANNSIVEHKRQDSQRSRMGCVLSSAIIDLKQRLLYMVHIGDSRLYQYNALGGLTKLSHDHSLVGYREEAGLISEYEAMHHAQRNVINRALGDALHNADDPQFLDAATIPILSSGQYLFCSDGLSDMLYSSNIAAVLASQATVEDKVKELIDAANQAGGKDNITVVIAQVDVPKALTRHSGEEPTDSSESETDSNVIVLDTNDMTTEVRVETQEDAVTRRSKSRKKKPHTDSVPRFSLYTLIVSIAASFIVGGTVGFIVGDTTAKNNMKVPEEQTAVSADSVVTQGNNPDSIYLDSLKVGTELAKKANDSIAGDTVKNKP